MDCGDSNSIQFVLTKRGGRKMLYNGRQYYKRKIYTNGNTFWLCYNKIQCKGNITLDSKNTFIKDKPHDDGCIPNFSKNIILKKINSLKIKVGENLDPIQKQFEETICELQDDGVDLVADLPKFSNIKSSLYNERHKKMGVTKLHFQNPLEVTIPLKYEYFLLADYKYEETRIMVFCPPDIHDLLNDYQHFLLDGTFKSCPSPFKQIYTIHGYKTTTKQVIPLIFAFLHNKNKKTYEILFDLLKSRLPAWNPLKITLDYEKAVMNALAIFFPATEIKGCFYHFCYSLQRKAKKMGLKSRVQRRHVSRCMGLARLPLKYIPAGYKYIMKRAPKCSQVVKFNSYFNSYWLNDVKFIKKWCCFGEELRTTNHLEGWHARLNRYVGRKNPPLAKVLDILVRETKIRTNTKTNKSKQYQEIDFEINSAVQDLEKNTISVGHCIEIIAPFCF